MKYTLPDEQSKTDHPDEFTTSSSSDSSDNSSSNFTGTSQLAEVYSKGSRRFANHIDIKIPKSLPHAHAVGTGVSAEPCPIKAWIGVEPYGDAPLKPGVADSGGPSLIGRTQAPNGCAISESPLQLKFQGGKENYRFSWLYCGTDLSPQCCCLEWRRKKCRNH